MTIISVVGRVVDADGPPQVHTVKRGDTIDAIARDFGITRKQLTDAVNQGAIVRNKMRGVGGGGNALGGFQERRTDWRTPLRQFVQEICEGDEMSTYNPPNRRFMPLDITDDAAVARFRDAAGDVDVVVNVAGWSKIEAFINTTDARVTLDVVRAHCAAQCRERRRQGSRRVFHAQFV